MPQERKYRYHFNKLVCARHNVSMTCATDTVGLMSAGRGGIYCHTKHFLALSLIDFVVLKPRLLNKQRIRAAAWSRNILCGAPAGAAFHNLQE